MQHTLATGSLFKADLSSSSSSAYKNAGKKIGCVVDTN